MIEYEDSKEVQAAVEKMISDTTLQQFNDIREAEVGIFSIMCTRTDAKDELVSPKGRPIICRKLPPPIQTLTGGHYMIIADYNFWSHANEIQRNANLYHALMHIQVEKGDEGKVKMGTRKPEVQVYNSELRLFGPHNLELLDMKEAIQSSAKKFAKDMRVAEEAA